MISSTFNEIRNSVDFPQILSPVYEYFYNYYISEENARYPVSLWHASYLVDRDIPKTNNAIEAWHMVFSSTFGTSKYNFQLLILKLKKEEEVIQQKFLRLLTGESPPRNRRYVRIEYNLRN